MSKELQASQLAWKKLRKILLRTALLAGLGTVAVYALSGGSVLLRADGMVTSQRVEVAAPWQDSRIREVYVRPGDWVEAGQKVAVVESAAISRSLADLAAEKARLISQKAQLNARKVAVSTLLPLAEVNANQAQSFFGQASERQRQRLDVVPGASGNVGCEHAGIGAIPVVTSRTSFVCGRSRGGECGARASVYRL
jgi:multidrug efflux pump subunit AcrA (membrane-fusion protein)